MEVDRIIFLLAIIRVAENQAAPYAGGESKCGSSEWQYLFVLSPAANEINLLTDLVESARSAIIRRPIIDGYPVQVIVSPEDFTEFEKKSKILKVYRSHILQCIDQKTKLALWSDVGILFKEPLSIISVRPSIPKFRASVFRTSRAVAKLQKRGKAKQESKEKSPSNLRKGIKRTKPKTRTKSPKNNDPSRGKGTRKEPKANAANKKTSFIPVRRTSTKEPWHRLMSMAAKSLTRSNNTSTTLKPGGQIKTISMAPGKLLSYAKIGSATKSSTSKKGSSKQAKWPKTKNARKSAVKTSASVTHKPKSSSTRNRVTQHLNSKARKTTVKSKGNRNSRELKISAVSESKCSIRRKLKRLVGHIVKRDFTFRAPMACAVIKISNSCDSDCTEDNEETSLETVAENTTDESSSEVSESPSTAEKEGSAIIDLLPEPELLPDELAEEVYVESPAQPSEPPLEQPEELVDSESLEPTINFSKNNEYDDTAQNYDDESLSELPDRLVVKGTIPEKSPYAPLDYGELLNSSFDEYSAPISPIFHNSEMPEYPMLQDGPPRQSLDYGSTWRNSSAMRPPFVSPISASRPVEEPRPSVRPGITFNTSLGSANTWPKPPEIPFGVPGGSEEEIEYVDYDEDDDEEVYDEGFEEDKKDKALEVAALSTIVQSQIDPEDKFDEFSVEENKIDDKEGEDDYEDEDYDGKDEDYKEDEDTHKDYGEERGNAAVRDEDDYDLDKD